MNVMVKKSNLLHLMIFVFCTGARKNALIQCFDVNAFQISIGAVMFAQGKCRIR